MKNSKWHLLAIGLTLVSLSSHAWASTNLSFGVAQTGSISEPGQTNSYTFSANADEVVDFTMVSTSGTLSPKIQLYNSVGKLLATAEDLDYSSCNGGSSVELNTFQISATGTYTVIVGDCSGTNTGDYALYAQLTNNPPGGVNLSFGQTEAGAIDSAAQSNTYTFSASVNDEVDFTMVRTSGSLSPKIRVYSGSTGALLATAEDLDYSSCNGGSSVELNTFQIPASGSYTVLVGDCGDSDTGNYEIYAQRTDKPSGPANLPFGQTQTGTINSAAQSNTYVFSANANDEVDFTMVRTSGSLSPKIRVYSGSTGALLATAEDLDYSSCNGGSSVELNTFQIPASGSYTVVVGDCSDTNAGIYEIYAQKTDNTPGAASLPLGQTATGLIGLAAQSNTYTFSASVNDVIDITMARTSGSLSPKIRLYSGSSGALLNTAEDLDYSSCNGGSTVEMNTFQIPASGIYSVLVGDCSDSNTGNYVIYAQRTNSPFGPVPLLWGGQVQSASISAAAQSNTYTFVGIANNVVDLTAVTTKGSLSPKIRLYNPDGTLLSTAEDLDYSSCNGGSTTEMNSVTLTQNGAYTVLLGDCSDSNTGNYNLSSQCFGTCPVTPTITWPTPAAITYGTPLSATQLDAAANAAGKFVYSPVSGTLLKAGTQTLSVVFTPTDTTDFTKAADNVQLTVNKATPVCTWATPAAIVYPTPLSATQLDASCSVPGTFVYSPPSGTVLTAGAHTLSVVFTPTDTTDYTTATETLQLTVTNTPTMITWATPAPITYGTPLSSTQLDAIATASITCVPIGCPLGVVVPGTYVYSPAVGTVLAAGAHTLSVTFTPTSPSYTSAKATVTLVVNKAVLTVTANKASRVHGEASPTFTSTITGFVNGDTRSVVSGAPSLTTTATVSSPVGTYPISAAAGTLSATNYTFKFVSGTLTITNSIPSAPTLISLSPGSGFVGGPAFTLTVTGTNFVNGSIVRWNGASLITTYVSPTQLKAAVPATELVAPGTPPVTVINPVAPIGPSNPLPFTITYPAPALTAISPDSITAGGSAFTLTLTGSNFVKQSVVKWNGTALTTTYVSGTKLEAAVPDSDSWTGTVSVKVFNPTPGGGTSGARTFTINNPVPILASLSPSSATAGGSSLTMTVNGYNFVEGAVVRWKTTALATTYLSGTQLQVTVPATDIATAGSASVTVANPAPSPSASNALTFTIN